MTEASSGIEKLKSKIGVEWQPREYEIGREMIRRFARAVGDPNPLWQDGAIAPPTFILAIGFEQFVDDLMSLAPFNTVLMGGTELECYQPIGLGDVITTIFKISNLRERQGKMGRMAFMTFDSSYKNQKQELVAKCRQMIIGY
ncbi:MAG: MaoC family dehydratase N-terminal domain-containing protein [Dehalococcoidales bacterium]|nr:MaoC family dehydratase N-terminal domain-containing protein [Dehalococcoidales bacterium]